MKKIYFILALSTAMLSTSCYMSRTSGHSGKVPPGQAKKAAGTKSAKHFAPGQQYKK
ncbi:quinol oxidase subunit 4 [Sphingobacterium sp. PCS056]|uniref:quinol oxidase subunit 4 n=1 Tax=Sphingobacterium TaxID=28453 RepID=UPI00200E04F9|nr:quinol oxidase subunit 4 [Sphingobacterium sp. PCS056]UPZ36073.1 quinol oxidase subunit 4 [Sphingobacterium sp. PCS056]